MAANEERRIVLVGKTGAGKSAAGNTILGAEEFKAELSPSSQTSKCQKARGTVGNHPVAVIDTPGLCDTNLKEEEVLERIKMCISLSAPGPHAFLVVIKLGRFTEEEQLSVEKIKFFFGVEAARYIMVLFTHGDRLKKQTIEEFVAKSEELQKIIDNCNGRYHVFNNEIKDISQVTRLLDKIDKMTACNGGDFYTSEMFKMAEEAIETEKARILKELEQRKKAELAFLKMTSRRAELQKKKEDLNRRYKMQARSQAEKSNSFTRARIMFKEMGRAALHGFRFGAAMGPLGMAAGTFLGAIGGIISGGVMIYSSEKKAKQLQL